jgi:hypothetical protein
MRELRMVGRRSTNEFERDGVKAVRDNVKSGHYDEPKTQEALSWLKEEKAKRTQFRDTRDLLTLARRTARNTRLTLVVAGLMLLILIAIVATLFVEQGVR